MPETATPLPHARTPRNPVWLDAIDVYKRSFDVRLAGLGPEALAGIKDLPTMKKPLVSIARGQNEMIRIVAQGGLSDAVNGADDDDDSEEEDGEEDDADEDRVQALCVLDYPSSREVTTLTPSRTRVSGESGQLRVVRVRQEQIPGPSSPPRTGLPSAPCPNGWASRSGASTPPRSAWRRERRRRYWRRCPSWPRP
jgi:hypothetical protein